MTVYIDLVLLLNFFLDFILLISVKVILKRNTKIARIILSTLIGSLSILLLFIPFNSLTLFLAKIIISIFMSLIAFGFKNLKYSINNLVYLYMNSTILGGFLYLLNIEFSYKRTGLVFFHNELSINFIFILISVPIFIYFYIKSNKNIKLNYNLYFDVLIGFDDLNIKRFTGFLDTGNKLKDPITNKSIILFEERQIRSLIHNRSPMYVPVKTINEYSLIKCFKPKILKVNNRQFSNYLIGVIDKKINIDGVNCLLNNNMLEEIYV